MAHDCALLALDRMAAEVAAHPPRDPLALSSSRKAARPPVPQGGLAAASLEEFHGIWVRKLNTSGCSMLLSDNFGVHSCCPLQELLSSFQGNNKRSRLKIVLTWLQNKVIRISSIFPHIMKLMGRSSS